MPPDNERLSQMLLEEAGTLQFFAVQLLSATIAGTFKNSFAGAAVYSGEHARRLARILEDDPVRDIDAVAWSARCLYETRMLLFHVLAQPKAQAEELLKHWVDQGDVQVAKTLTDLYSDSDSEKQRLTAELRQFGLPKLPKEMAKLTGCLDEHRMVYGLLCLYTHPSKWLLFGNSSIARDPQLTHVFCQRALYYLKEIHEAIAYLVDHVGNDGVPIDPSPKSKVGILAFGSLIGDPGKELLPKITMRIKTLTPFGVEYGRMSQTRGGAPTLVQHDAGAPVEGEILVLAETVSVDEARNMLWRRERRIEGSGKTYVEEPGANKVLVRDWIDSPVVEHVLYTDFHAEDKIAEPQAEDLAKRAIESVKAAKEGLDGITYLKNNLASGVKTKLSADYEAEILKQTETRSLNEAITAAKKT